MSKRKRDVSVSTMNLNDLFGDSVQNSAIYFKLLLWGCLAFKFYTNLWLLTLLPVAGFLLLLKMINRYFSLSDWAIAKVGWFVFFFFFFFFLLLFVFFQVYVVLYTVCCFVIVVLVVCVSVFLSPRQEG